MSSEASTKDTQDKGTQTAENENHFVPNSFLPFFPLHLYGGGSHIGLKSDELVDGSPRSLSKDWALKCTLLIYSEKMIADDERISKGKQKQPLSEFIFELFMSLFGNRETAQSVRRDFLAADKSDSSCWTCLGASESTNRTQE
jgi:hypothetical protein